MTNPRVKFSHHAVQRFKERFGDIVKEYNGNKILAIAEMYRKSKINNRIKNDTRFMTYVYDAHGYSDFGLYVVNNIVFVIKDETMVTIMAMDNYKNKMFSTSSSRFKSA